MVKLKTKLCKILSVILSFVLILNISIPKAYADSNLANDNYTYTDSSVKSIVQQITELEGVSDVTILPTSNGSNFKQVISFFVEQPISWENKSLGSFKQHVVLNYNQQAGLTVFESGGYSLISCGYAQSAFGSSKNENFVMMEYRFFGNSRPEGLDNTKHNMWEYCTEENAANDFHAIYQKLHTILSGKSIMTGVSKGGYTTNYQAYYQDMHGVTDFDAFYAYSSPLCTSTNDSRCWDFINESAGDSSFGTEKGAQLRQIIFDMQLALFEVKTEYAPQLWNDFKGHLSLDFFKYDETTNAYKWFDYIVSNVAADFWLQYSDVTVKKYSNVLAMTGEERNTSLKNILDLALDNQRYSSIDSNAMFPYYIQAYHTMGELKLCWDELRKAASDKHAADPAYPEITLTEEECNSYQTKILLTDDIKNCDTLKYDPSVHNALAAWYPTTKQNIIYFYGDVDPWKAVGVSKIETNLHIQNYLAYKVGHMCMPSNLSQSEQTRFWNYYNSALSLDIKDATIEIKNTSTTNTNNETSLKSNVLNETAYANVESTPEISVTYQGIIVPQDNYSVTWSQMDAGGSLTATITGQKAFNGAVDTTINLNSSSNNSADTGSDYLADTGDQVTLILNLCVLLMLFCFVSASVSVYKH